MGCGVVVDVLWEEELDTADDVDEADADLCESRDGEWARCVFFGFGGGFVDAMRGVIVLLAVRAHDRCGMSSRIPLPADEFMLTTRVQFYLPEW